RTRLSPPSPSPRVRVRPRVLAHHSKSLDEAPCAREPRCLNRSLRAARGGPTIPLPAEPVQRPQQPRKVHVTFLSCGPISAGRPTLSLSTNVRRQKNARVQ